MLYKGVKYACGTCIKGHRSSQCTHAERPLFEIRKKGRPVTQCSLCRDLRKHKQVHIKCACTHKSTKASAVVPDIRDKCTCSDLNHDHHLPITTTTIQNDAVGYVVNPFDTSTGDELYSSLLSSSSSTNIPEDPQQHQSSMIDTSFTWALVTPTPVNEETLLGNDDSTELGFLFHKPSSRRFLDGQPRPPRKKSAKKQKAAALPPPQSLCQQQSPITLAHTSSSIMASTIMPPTSSATIATMANNSQKQLMLPFMNMDLSSSTSSSSASSLSSSSSCMDGTTITTGMGMIFSNVLEQQHTDDQNLAIHNNSDFDRWIDSTDLGTSSTTDTISHPQSFPKQLQTSIHSASEYCGMNPGQGVCRSKHTANGPGESVLITITPLSSIASTSPALQSKVRTRLATCYCTNQCCICPGCLVHPFAGGGNGGMAGSWHDPLALCTSSATSSLYSTSDDEDHHHQQQPAALLG